MKTVFLILMFLLVASLAETTPVTSVSNNVTVLDVTVENPATVANRTTDEGNQWS